LTIYADAGITMNECRIFAETTAAPTFSQHNAPPPVGKRFSKIIYS